MTWHTKRDGEWKHSNGLSRARSQFKFEGAWVFAKNNSPVEEPGSNIRILHYMKVAGVWRLTTELPSTLADYGVTLTKRLNGLPSVSMNSKQSVPLMEQSRRWRSSLDLSGLTWLRL